MSDPTYYVSTASPCYIQADNSVLVCQTGAGAGSNLYVQVTVGGQTAPIPAATISYRPPILTGGITGRGADLATTSGGEQVIISGLQLGPVTTWVNGNIPVPYAGATYAAPGGYRSFSAVSCQVTKQDTTMTCLTAPGSGKDLLWNVTVAGQTSPILTTRPTSYAAPVTGTFTGPGSNLAKTYGYEMVYIGGASAC